MTAVSAGILCYRHAAHGVEVLIAHPGGPFWAKRDNGAWTIPKGELDRDEDPWEGAIREFREEIGVDLAGSPKVALGTVTQRSGKLVHAFAVEYDLDPERITSNPVRMEWPRGSGRTIEFPEVDRVAWVDPETALLKLNAAQTDFISRLLRDAL
jgi:predicted NUDIX family NTP pyrophosphohydrolase